MKLMIELIPEEVGGFTARVPALPGCVSQGDTREEALANIKDAIALYLDSYTDVTTPGREIATVEV